MQLISALSGVLALSAMAMARDPVPAPVPVHRPVEPQRCQQYCGNTPGCVPCQSPPSPPPPPPPQPCADCERPCKECAPQPVHIPRPARPAPVQRPRPVRPVPRPQLDDYPPECSNRASGFTITTFKVTSIGKENCQITVRLEGTDELRQQGFSCAATWQDGIEKVPAESPTSCGDSSGFWWELQYESVDRVRVQIFSSFPDQCTGNRRNDRQFFRQLSGNQQDAQCELKCGDGHDNGQPQNWCELKERLRIEETYKSSTSYRRTTTYQGSGSSYQ